MTAGLSHRISELTGQRVPFVRATVVRAQNPTSAHPGDEAIVLADGTIEGFVGGQCASGSVRTAALGALEGGESVLLRVLPGGDQDFPESDGARVVVNPCLSGGALEIFLEPLLPSPLVSVYGTTPTADALAALGPTLGFAVVQDRAGADMPEDTVALIIASHGGDEAGQIRRALAAGVPFIGLVASTQRGNGLLAEMDLDPAARQRIHTPVGLDIGARTPPEIALSVMAQLVRKTRLEGLGARAIPVSVPTQVVDPVCGMTVSVGPDTPHAVVDGADVWFCGPGCRDSYLREHAAAGA